MDSVRVIFVADGHACPQEFSVTSVAVQDMTQALRLRGNHIYVLWRKNNSLPEPKLPGERLL